MLFRKYYILVVIISIMICLPVVSEGPAGVIELEGIIEPSEVVDVSSQVPGILSDVLVERGDFVKKGEVLVRLISGVEKAAVELAKARVDFGKRKVDRNEELYKKQLISIHEKDEMATELMISELQEKEATERLKLRTIRSTIDGVVIQRLGAPGEYVGEEPFLSIAKINPLNVEVVAPVALVGSIKKGTTATVIPEVPVGGEYAAKVIIVDRVIDAASGTFGVRLSLPNPNNKLPAGLKCHVRFSEQ